MVGGAPRKKIGILVVAYNAVSTLATVLDRIPPAFRPKVAEVVVSDDASQDSTYLVGLGYSQTSDLPITVIRQPRNLGYGGNQKAGYRYAIDHGLDIVVLLHGDGQYAPESLPEIVAPLERGECDAVFGSRMMIKGAARRGGMPLYKFVGNRVLSTLENAALGSDLSEFHSGYRAYSVQALRQIPFERNSDGFNFDTQIIIQLHDAQKRVLEVPIPTYYGDEISHVNGLRYAWDVTSDVLAYRLQKMGFGDGERVALGEEYRLKESPDSSHGRIFARLASRPRSRILDLGCSSGQLTKRLQASPATSATSPAAGIAVTSFVTVAVPYRTTGATTISSRPAPSGSGSIAMTRPAAHRSSRPAISQTMPVARVASSVLSMPSSFCAAQRIGRVSA